MKVRCWLRLGLELILWSVIAACILLVLNRFHAAEGGLIDAVSVFPHLILFGSALFAALMGISVYQLYLPVYLSFGSTRRDAQLGIHLMQLVVAGGGTVLAAVLCLLVPGDPARDLLPLLPAAFLALLLFAKFGSLLGCGLLALPRAGRVLCTIFVSLLSGAAGFCGVMAADMLTTPMTLSLPAWLTLVFALVLVILLAVEVPLQRRILLRYEVKL